MWLILILAGILRLLSLNQSFWLDETAQAVLSNKPIFSVNYAADFQPPLFYIFSHFWIKFGAILGTNAEWFLRLPSIFFSVFTVYLCFTFFSHVFNKKIGLLTTIFLSTAPFHIYYAQEFRMYSLLTLLGLVSWMFIWHKKWKLYSLTVFFSIFTHYFSFIFILSQLIFVFFTQKKDLKKILTSLLVGCSPFLLWIPTFLKQIETSKHLLQAWPGWGALSNVGFFKFPALTLAKFTVGMISPHNKFEYAGAVSIMGIISLVSLWNIAKSKSFKNREGVLLLCSLVIPLILTWLGGLFISASSPWRIQFVLPFFYSAIALGLSQLDTGRTQNIFKLAIITIILSNLYFSSQYLLKPIFHREDWRGAISYSDSKIGPSDVVLSEYIGPWVPMEWYSQKFTQYSGASSAQRVSQQSAEDKLGPILKIQKPQRIVLYTYLFEISDPEQQVGAYLLQNKYQLTEEKDFQGVGIVKTYERLTNQAK